MTDKTDETVTEILKELDAESKPHDPAYPIAHRESELHPDAFYSGATGLTAHELVALKTLEPCGTPWLDAMTRAAKRRELAGQAMAATLSNQTAVKKLLDGHDTYEDAVAVLTHSATLNADALLAKLDK